MIHYELYKMGVKSPLELEFMQQLEILGKTFPNYPTCLHKSVKKDIEIVGGTQIEDVKKFSTIIATSGVFKGKWCYEVILQTNTLFCIGWYQSNFPFTQSFKGDCENYYWYDGYRLLKWKNIKEKNGDNWDR